MHSRFFKALAAGLLVALGAGSANATLIQTGSEQPLQSVINGLYQSASCPTCSPVINAPNVNTNQVASDERWSIEASGTAAATFIIEIAGNSTTNTFGLYDLNNGNTVELFNGAADSADRATIQLFDDGSLYVFFTPMAPNPDPGATAPTLASYGAGHFSGNSFGFYLGTTAGMLYSEAARNAGGVDQMVAYQGDGDKIKLPGASPGNWGSSSFILAWEDLGFRANSDRDFNDLVVYVESIKPLPEPGSLALMGIGLLGLMAATSRRRQHAARA